MLCRDGNQTLRLLSMYLTPKEFFFLTIGLYWIRVLIYKIGVVVYQGLIECYIIANVARRA